MNTKQEAIYCAETGVDPEQLSFIVRLATVATYQQCDFTSQLCLFAVAFNSTDDKIMIKILILDDSDYLALARFTEYSVTIAKQTFSGSLMYEHFGKYGLYENDPKNSIKRQSLEPNAGCFELEFRLKRGTSNNSLQQPSFSRVIVERLFYDSTGKDVTFICEDIFKKNSHNNTEQVDHLNQDTNVGDVASLAVSESVHQDQPQKRGIAPNSGVETGTSVVAAHKAVITQWPYFKKMFSSEFVEGASHTAPIRIKDVNTKTFKAMVYFMYVGEVHDGPVQISRCHDPTQATETSWELLYLAADRYRIDDLRKLALDKIIKSLGKMDTFELLFRSAYMFEELRDPVVKYIAQHGHTEIAKKEVREKYMDHPDYRELLGELFDAYHACKEGP